MKKILFLLSLCSMIFSVNVCVAEEDNAFFDDFAIIEDTESDMNVEKVSLNSGARFVNVKQFDIAGIMLGMSYDEINDLFFNDKGLYAPTKNNSVIYTVNKEWEYNLDYECRQNNVFIPEQLKKCIWSSARNRGLLYVSEIHLERPFTGETIDVYLTSNATDNVVWKVVYKNDVDNMDGSNPKFANQREKKILSFWQGVLDKYGEPNSDEDKWISSDNAYDPMLRAFYGELVLVDNGLNTIDSSENINAARRNFQAKPYAF